MKLLLLTAIFITLVLVHECQGYPPIIEPCQQQTSAQAYQTFEKRHIITSTFDRNSLQAWATYLRQNNLCGRTPTQSFIDARKPDVKKICSYAGRLVQGAPASEGDNCMSSSKMTVYQVKSDMRCNVSDAKAVSQYVVVTCAIAGRNCLPIHYVASRNPQPSTQHCVPPRAG